MTEKGKAMGYELLTAQDGEQLKAAGISPTKAKAQLDFFKRGSKPLYLNRPCTAGDGIIIIPEEELKTLAGRHDEAANAGRCMKFVPASGAASRMFLDWHNALIKGVFPHPDLGKTLAENLPKFAFFRDLKEGMSSRGQDVSALMEKGDLHYILDYILSPKGMNYGHLPKALLKFHNSEEGGRTAIEEHLVEAALYTADRQRVCRIHFTVSEEHRKQTAAFLEKIKEVHEARLGVTFRIGLSYQSGSSRTLAIEGDNLYRDHAGRLILRPGGHGALLENLNAIDGDIVFIKNIDNVVPDSLKADMVFNKKVLGGYFISLEEEIFRHLRNLSFGKTAAAVATAKLFCQQKLHIAFSAGFADLPLAQQQRMVAERLHRPLRVCGMVKNEGEPGGGPFWVDEGKELSLQIVEGHQIDCGSAAQKAIWSASTHFNPVDLVCGLRDYQGRKFDLTSFVDPTAVSLSEKIEKARHIKVLEHPGLWNGAMARWNTVFVEVPNATFNPVKTIADLLRPQHQA